MRKKCKKKTLRKRIETNDSERKYPQKKGIPQIAPHKQDRESTETADENRQSKSSERWLMRGLRGER